MTSELESWVLRIFYLQEYHLHKDDGRVFLQNIEVLYCHHDECSNRQDPLI